MYCLTPRKNNPLKLIASVAPVALIILSSSTALGQEIVLPEVLVTASLDGIDSKKVGSAFTVITGEQLKNSGTTYVSDALRSVPGVSVSRTGGSGSFTQVRLRGAEANQVLVLIDGIEVSNPVQGEYDFAGLLVQNIDRIEVLRGPQSALWGSNATAGVINIITKKATQGLRTTGFLEGGSFSTLRANTGISYGAKRVRGALNLGFFRTNGTNNSFLGSERDGDRNFTASFNGDVDLTENLNIEGILRYTDKNGELDPQDFAFPATPTQGLVIDGDAESKSKEFFGRLSARLSLFDDRWVQKFSGAMADVNRDSLTNGAKTSGTDGKRSTFSYLSTVKFETPNFLNARHTFSGLVERKYETFRNTSPTANPAQTALKKRTLYGFAGEYRVDLFDNLFLSAAARYNKNDAFKDASTFRVTAAYLIDRTNTRLHTSLGSGITNPTFFEQFGFNPLTFDGNPNLKPERSLGWDAGIEQTFFDDRLTIDVTYFQSRLKNEILGTFDFATFRSSVANLSGKSKRQGIEVTATARPLENVDLRASYTYTNSKDANGVTEVRRPKHIASFDATARFLEDRLTFNLGVAYNGKNEDLEFIAATPATRVILDDFVLVNLSASYQITDNVQWVGRVENALNTQYQEVFSFNTPGVAAYSGFRVNF